MLLRLDVCPSSWKPSALLSLSTQRKRHQVSKYNLLVSHSLLAPAPHMLSQDATGGVHVHARARVSPGLCQCWAAWLAAVEGHPGPFF